MATNYSLNPILARHMEIVGLFQKKQREKVIDAINGALLQRIVAGVLKKLSKKKQAELDEIMAVKDEKKISEFLKKNIKDYEKFLGEEINDFQKELFQVTLKLVKKG